MSPQADFIVSNGTGAAVRSDLNVQFAAIVSNNSGATEPATMYAYQWWADTTAGLLKLRNSANSAWITMRQLDGEFSTVPVENGSAAAPSIYFKDSGTDSGFFSPGTDAVAISTAGTNRLHITSGGLVGIGTGSPSELLHIAGVTNPGIVLQDTTNNTDARIKTNNNGDLVFEADYNAEAADTRISFEIDGSEKARFDSSGRLGIGSTAPDVLITGKQTNAGAVGATLRLVNASTTVNTATQLAFTNSTAETANSAAITAVRTGSGQYMTFAVEGNEAVRIDESRRLLVGTSSAVTGATAQFSRIVALGNSGGATNPGVISIGMGAVPASGNNIGRIFFVDNAAGEYAEIAAQCDGTPGSGDYPGRLVFSTTADGASSPTERIRINHDGWLISGGSSDNNPSGNNAVNVYSLGDGRARFSTDLNVSVECNRKGNDGSLINFRQDSTVEGSISVSGTTVSYNGAHLSRWSQLASGAERTEILRGSVLSNLDEMCEWGEEDNEQLNRMKISTVEGDKNVSGVFQTWDDDDDTYTNDFYCAMTGDFIIRIAEGVTIERGDLLMSAGDGTAKPQGDGFVQDKTIAKVTSTNVSCTYDDGSYCVPCVLMAC